MSERPTLTISAPCPTCGGKGKRYTNGECEDCDGIGTVRKQVSCAGCKWYQKAIIRDSGTCRNRKSFAHEQPVTRDWGCLSWEAKA